jgi:hypothetical protein
VLDFIAARRIAEAVDQNLAIHEGAARELEYGWYFPYRETAEPVVGSHGIIVNKSTGKVLRLGSRFPRERDLTMYDRGYQFDSYDLVVLEVHNMESTLDVLLRLGLSKTEPEYKHGTVWRIPSALSRLELASRLSILPCVFGNTSLYFTLEVLEQARSAGHFRFEVVEYTGPRTLET